jgi:hypothetical protein
MQYWKMNAKPVRVEKAAGLWGNLHVRASWGAACCAPYKERRLVGGRDGVVLFGEGGAEAEEFVAAGVAAERRKSQEASGEGEETGDVLGGHALEVGVAAIAAVGVERETERDGACVEALFAGFAAPRENIEGADEIVRESAPLGAADFRGVTIWAGDGQGVGRRTEACNAQECATGHSIGEV